MEAITVEAHVTASVEQAVARFTEPAWITRWNAAADTWCCPTATSELREGGAFCYRMAARDGSMAFDYEGTWEVVEPTRLVQRLGDGRRVEVTFVPEGDGTRVVERFEPESMNPPELQQAGWQAILHRYADVAGGREAILLKEVDKRFFVGIRRTVPVSTLPAFFDEVLPTVMGWMQKQGIPAAAPPMALWCAMDMQTGIADCHAGCFVEGAGTADGEITFGETPAGSVLSVVHTGSYRSLGRTWMAVYRRASELGKTPGAGWEVYLDDPTVTDAAQLRTQIFLPVS